MGGRLDTRPSSCDLAGETTAGGQHVDAALAGGIHGNSDLKGVSQESIDRSEQPRPAAHRGPVRPSPYGEAATRASIYKDSDRVPPASAGNIYDVFAEFDRISRRDRIGPGSQGRQQRSSSSRPNPPSSGCSIAEVAVEAVRNRDIMDSSARSCTEPTSEDLCLKHDNSEGPDDGIVLGREPSAASRGSSASHDSPLSVEGSVGPADIGRRQESFRSGTQGEFMFLSPPTSGIASNGELCRRCHQRRCYQDGPQQQYRSCKPASGTAAKPAPSKTL